MDSTSQGTQTPELPAKAETPLSVETIYGSQWVEDALSRELPIGKIVGEVRSNGTLSGYKLSQTREEVAEVISAAEHDSFVYSEEAAEDGDRKLALEAAEAAAATGRYTLSRRFPETDAPTEPTVESAYGYRLIDLLIEDGATIGKVGSRASEQITLIQTREELLALIALAKPNYERYEEREVFDAAPVDLALAYSARFAVKQAEGALNHLDKQAAKAEATSPGEEV